MIEVLAPMLSVNEPEAQVVELFVSPGQKIAVGDPLCTLETTKATFEVQAENEGYVHEILITKGTQVTAGTVLFLISSEQPAEVTVAVEATEAADKKPEGLRITDKAMRLSGELGVALSSLPIGPMVTEATVREVAARSVSAPRIEAAKRTLEIKTAFDANKIVIFGAGGHAKTLIDLIHQGNHYELVGLIGEPLPDEQEVLGVPLLGTEEIAEWVLSQGIRLMVNGVGAINRNRTRLEIFARMAERGFVFPRVVHPSAVVEPSAKLAGGVQVFGRAFIGSAAQIGFGAIVNTGAIVSHDCHIGDLVHLTPGVVLAGSVRVGTGALVGMGVTTAIGVKIGEWARIGNGAKINGNVPDNGIVQAGANWP